MRQLRAWRGRCSGEGGGSADRVSNIVVALPPLAVTGFTYAKGRLLEPCQPRFACPWNGEEAAVVCVSIPVAQATEDTRGLFQFLVSEVSADCLSLLFLGLP